MILIEDNINKVVGKGNLNKSFVELHNEFNDKYEKIEEFKEDPYSDDYHNKYNDLKKLDNRIKNIQVG